MANSRVVMQNKAADYKPGDAAVDGLFHGATAGLPVAIFLVVISLSLNLEPGAVLARFVPEAKNSILVAALIHLAISGIYGIVFAVLWLPLSRRFTSRRAALLAGLCYGLIFPTALLFIFAPGSEIPAVYWIVAHLIYGLVLGFLVGRSRNVSAER
jgi:hypothetical protein